MNLLKSLIKSPLLHFCVSGYLLFLFYSYLNPTISTHDNRIIINQKQIQYIASTYEKRWNRQPSDTELKNLLDEYITTEIYYREGYKLGLDKNDPMIKRRIRQKFELISSDIISVLDVTDVQLQQYLDNNQEKFTSDSFYSFEQLYINPQKHTDNLKSYLNTVHAQLVATDDAQSDSLMIPKSYTNITSTRLKSNFGEGFSAKLDMLKIGKWSKPIQSGLGLHFVKISNRTSAKTPDINAIRKILMREYLQNQQNKMLEVQRLKMRNKYDIRIEGSSLSKTTHNNAKR